MTALAPLLAINRPGAQGKIRWLLACGERDKHPLATATIRAVSVIISGADLVTPDLLGPGWIEVDDGVITDIGSGTAPRPPDVMLPRGYLTPGFIDIHTHGGGGASVVGADPSAVATFAQAHRRHGTTSLMCSLVSAYPESLAHDVAALADLTEDGVILGTHLEGPWISPAFRGAHDPGTLRDPDPAEVAHLLEIGRGTVKMVTLAPEHPHGIEAVALTVQGGAIAAIGHSDATYAQTKAAIDAGATCATHLFNAMRGVHHREPGPIVALTEDPRVTCELILDGVHLSPASAAFAVRSCAGRVVLVTDAMAAAAAEDGDYMLGDLPVTVSQGVARLTDGTIAGSTLTMDAAVRNAIRHVGLGVSAAVAAATATPADMLGLADRGRLQVGARADLVHLDESFHVSRVWLAGHEVE